MNTGALLKNRCQWEGEGVEGRETERNKKWKKTIKQKTDAPKNFLNEALTTRSKADLVRNRKCYFITLFSCYGI
jgi:hypothetical protein